MDDYEFLAKDHTSKARLNSLLDNLQMDIEDGKNVFVVVSNESDRTADQNKLLWRVHYHYIADKIGISVEEVAARCKRKFGVPLMRRITKDGTKRAKNIARELYRFGWLSEDEAEKDWVKIIDMTQMQVDSLFIETMALMDCTKLLNTKEFWEYLKMLEEWAAIEHGLVLESINETLRNRALNLN